MVPAEIYREDNLDARFEDIDPLNQRCLTDKEIEILEQKIRKKVRDYYDMTNKNDGYLPAHSQSIAIVHLLHEYTTRNSKYVEKYKDEEYQLYEYGLEICETCRDVLKSYSPDQGDFIHYYNRSIARTLARTKGERNYARKHQGSTMSDNKIRTVSKLIRMVKEQPTGYEITVEKVLDMAEKENIRLMSYEVLEYISPDRSLDETIDSDKDSVVFGDTITLSDLSNSGMISVLETPENVVISSEGVQEYMNIIARLENAFLKTQERQRKYLSEALTAKLSEAIYQIMETDPGILKKLDSVTWFDSKTFSSYLETGQQVLQKDIAENNGITKEGLSTAMARMLSQLQKERM